MSAAGRLPMTEDQDHLQQVTEALSQAMRNWNDRSPTIVASMLQSYSIPVLMEIVARTPESPYELELHQALARLALNSYTQQESDLERYRSELWEIMGSNDARLPVLQSFLRAVQEMTIQQRNHPSRDKYTALKLLSEEVLLELKNRPLRQYPRRKKRVYAVKVARTAELPDISQLTSQPVERLVKSRGKTQTLSELPSSINLQAANPHRDFIFDPGRIAAHPDRAAEFLRWLPPIYALLEGWDDEASPLQMADLLQDLSPQQALEYSAWVLPHRKQTTYLRHLGIYLHLRLLQEVPLPHLSEALRRLVTLEDAAIQAVLPAVIYYMYCSSHTFYAIQEHAIRKLGFQRSYLYHLITQEWAKNKVMSTFLRASLPRAEAARNLSPSDWSFVFYLLNQGQAQSVIRDVYGVFHGSAFFADHIVDPDTSKGFGHLNETGKGVSFTLATQQISDLLRGHKGASDASTRQQQFEQYVEERFKKDLQRKEGRLILNAPTLKRLERFVLQAFQRGESEHMAYETIAGTIARESLQAFATLSPERLSWLAYELSRYILGQVGDAGSNLQEAAKGIIGALLDFLAAELYPRRAREADALSHHLWEGFFFSLMDTAYLDYMAPEALQQLVQQASEQVQRHRDRVLEPARRQFFSQF